MTLGDKLRDAMKPMAQALAQNRERFLALQVRERWMLGVGSLVVVVTFIYLAVWEPITNAHANRTLALEASRALAVRLEHAAVQVGQLRHVPPRGARGGSLMAAVDMASKQSGLGKGPSRIQPEGDREVRVWFEDISFDLLVGWLSSLQKRDGISLQTFEVEPQASPGRVNVRLSLVRS